MYLVRRKFVGRVCGIVASLFQKDVVVLRNLTFAEWNKVDQVKVYLVVTGLLSFEKKIKVFKSGFPQAGLIVEAHDVFEVHA